MAAPTLKIDGARFIVTVDPERRIIRDGAILIEGQRIVQVGKATALQHVTADRVIDASCVDRITEPADLAPVLRRALSHRHPHFIELMTPYEECLPLMPPGQSFNEMIL